MINEKKRGPRGIGLLNINRCVESYEGSIIYKNIDNLLICDIIIIDNGRIESAIMGNKCIIVYFGTGSLGHMQF